MTPPKFRVGALWAVLFLGACVPSDGAAGPTYVIPVKGQIERGLVYIVRRGVAQALERNAAAIVFDMDTPGGRLDAAEEIIRIVASVKVPTYTFVNPNAISAGAIIAMATDHIYMAPGSKIGDALPLMMTPFGGPQQMTENMEEKAVSYVAGLIRSAAQRKGHDPKLAEAMVRRDVEYKIGDETIDGKGQILTLTNVEAEREVEIDGRKRPLLSRGTVADLAALRQRIGVADQPVVQLAETSAESMARYIEMFSALFLAGGLLSLYIEFKTPGFGLPGILGILLLAIWFWGHHVAGLAGGIEIVLFVVGAALVLVEVFFIPGFGFFGVAGIGLMVAGLFMAMVEHYPGLPWYRLREWQVAIPVRNMGIALITVFVSAILLLRFLPRTGAYGHLMLSSAASRERGYQASHERAGLVGARGEALTALRPSGIGLFDGRRIDVVTRGQFVEKGTPIVVAETHGSRVVVAGEPPAPRATT